MIRSILAASLAVCLSSQVFAVERGSFGVSVETPSLFSLLGSAMGSGVMPPMASVGVRVSPSTALDLDFSYGFALLTKVKTDTAGTVTTSGQNSEFSQSLSAGVVVNPYQGERAIFGIYGRFVGTFSKVDISQIGRAHV